MLKERVSDSYNPPAFVHAGEDSLLTGIRSRDAEAMGKVFACYASIVYDVSLRILRQPSSAEDVLQEVFIKLWRNPNAFSSQRGALGAWLAVIARNRSIDVLRQRHLEDSTDNVVLTNGINYADLAERNCMMVKVRNAMAALPDTQRRVIECAFFEGKTHIEIAEATGIPLGTVKTRIRTALLSLRKALRDRSHRNIDCESLCNHR